MRQQIFSFKQFLTITVAPQPYSKEILLMISPNLTLIKLAILPLALFLISCQTTTNTSSSSSSSSSSTENHFTEGMKKTYETYLKNKQFRGPDKGPNTGSALAFNPQTGISLAFYPGSRNRIPFWAQDTALEECGTDCYLYAINEKIVWEKQTIPLDQQRLLIRIENQEKAKSSASLAQQTATHPKKPISTPSIQHYKPALFDLTTSQITAFGDYLTSVTFLAKSRRHYAFAVSDQGHIATAENGRSFEAQLDAIRNCEAIAIGSHCYLYAVNKKVLHNILGQGIDISTVHTVPLSETDKTSLSYTADEYSTADIDLTPKQQNEFIEYQSEALFKDPWLTYAFAVSHDGKTGSAKNVSSDVAKSQALSVCETYGSLCFLYAVDDNILFEKPNN